MLTASRPRDARDHQRARGRRAEPLAHEKLGANDLDVPGHPGPAQLAQGVEVGRPKVVGKCPANLVGRVNLPEAMRRRNASAAMSTRTTSPERTNSSGTNSTAPTPVILAA